MTKAEMKDGLLRGGLLIQEEWADRKEIEAIDQLVAEGIVYATEWTYRDNFQCKRRMVSKLSKNKT